MASMQEMEEIFNSVIVGITSENKDAKLVELASNGLGPYWGIKLLRDGLNYPANDAKREVHFHKAWESIRTATAEMHNVLENIIEDYEDKNANT